MLLKPVFKRPPLYQFLLIVFAGQDSFVFNPKNIFSQLGMGENNATWKRKNILHRDTMFAASSIYQGMDFILSIYFFRVLFRHSQKSGLSAFIHYMNSSIVWIILLFYYVISERTDIQTD